MMPDHATKIMINMLFARFHHIYTHRFESAYPDDETLALAKREWSFALRDIPMAAVEATINRVRDEQAWPPTIAEFLAALYLAAPPEEMPAPYAAYQESCLHASQPHTHHWCHPAVFWAAQNTGFRLLREGVEAQVWPNYRRHYQGLMLEVLRGAVLKLPQILAVTQQTNQATTAAAQSEAWCLKHQLEAAEVAHLLHYLELPLQSSVRHNFRTRTLAELERRGLPCSGLPE